MLFRRSKSVTPSEASAALRRGELQLVDVRASAELADGRVEGAAHIPLTQLSARLGELDPIAPGRLPLPLRRAQRAGDARRRPRRTRCRERPGRRDRLEARRAATRLRPQRRRRVIFRQLTHDDLGSYAPTATRAE